MANNIAPLAWEHRTFNKFRPVLTVFSIPQNSESEKKSCPAYWPQRVRSCADWHSDAGAGRDHRERCVAVGDVQARDGVIHSNPTARGNPKALAQLDSYKRPLVGFLSANLQRFGMEKVSAVYRGLRGSVLFD